MTALNSVFVILWFCTCLLSFFSPLVCIMAKNSWVDTHLSADTILTSSVDSNVAITTSFNAVSIHNARGNSFFQSIFNTSSLTNYQICKNIDSPITDFVGVNLIDNTFKDTQVDKTNYRNSEINTWIGSDVVKGTSLNNLHSNIFLSSTLEHTTIDVFAYNIVINSILNDATITKSGGNIIINTDLTGLIIDDATNLIVVNGILLGINYGGIRPLTPDSLAKIAQHKIEFPHATPVRPQHISAFKKRSEQQTTNAKAEEHRLSAAMPQQLQPQA